MAKKTTTPTIDDVKSAFESAIDTLFSALNGSTTAPAKSETAKSAKAVDVEVLDRDEVESMGIKDLRTLAAGHGIELKKKAEILAAFEENGLFGESEEEDEEESEEEDEDEDESEEEEDEEESEDEGEEEYDRESLEEMTLKEVRAIAKEKEIATKGLDQDALIDAILGEGDEDEDEDEEDEEEGEEEVEIDEDALNGMTLAELKKLAKEIDVKVKVPASAKNDAKKKAVYVKAILDSAEEE